MTCELNLVTLQCVTVSMKVLSILLVTFFAFRTRGPAVDSWNSVTANQIEAFQTADQTAEMMSQPIRFFHVFLWIGSGCPFYL